jgi:hypothetical protein
MRNAHEAIGDAVAPTELQDLGESSHGRLEVALAEVDLREVLPRAAKVRELGHRVQIGALGPDQVVRLVVDVADREVEHRARALAARTLQHVGSLHRLVRADEVEDLGHRLALVLVDRGLDVGLGEEALDKSALERRRLKETGNLAEIRLFVLRDGGTKSHARLQRPRSRAAGLDDLRRLCLGGGGLLHELPGQRLARRLGFERRHLHRCTGGQPQNSGAGQSQRHARSGDQRQGRMNSEHSHGPSHQRPLGKSNGTTMRNRTGLPLRLPGLYFHFLIAVSAAFWKTGSEAFGLRTLALLMRPLVSTT